MSNVDELIRRQRRAVRNMPPVVTCDNCGLCYYQTSAPHVCAGWAGEAKEKQTMTRISETLDTEAVLQHLLEHSLVAQRLRVEGRSRGTSDLREIVAMTLDFTSDAKQPATEHEPVARGRESKRVILNSDLVVRPLPNTTKFLLVTEDDWPIAEFYREEEAEGIAYEHNQHHSLLAERERLREALSDMLAVVEDEGHVSNYVPQVTAARKILAETALTMAAARKAVE